MKTCFPESKSIPTPCQECPSSCRTDSFRLRNGIEAIQQLRTIPQRMTSNLGKIPMSTITTRDGTQIYYKDWGKGPVVTFSHGWPLSSDAWDGQLLFL